MSRSYDLITDNDLKILVELARKDRTDLFVRKPDTGRLYSKRLFAVALCQGGALHYLDGKNGVKDLDVWSFYTEDTERPFPYRRRGESDFGIPKFGKTIGYEHFEGRKVDLIGRSLRNADVNDPVGTLRKYLRNGKTEAARQLANKAVILIEPANLFGTVVWPE
jgi:hypothetical protein